MKKIILIASFLIGLSTLAIAQSSSPLPPGTSVTKKIPGIYPHASERLLTASDLVGMDSWDLIIIRNEIYARHGYIFKLQKLKDYFSKQSWYVPRYDNVESKLSVIEQKNVMFIKSFE
ncbi:MAG: YARHG domain-containing protein [Bacteroidetes bacterium]|nr:YARHG domain-containing protein [Bacteroidota bacterium]